MTAVPPTTTLDRERDPLAPAIEALVRAEHGDPFALLGMHTDGPNGAVTVRTFLPEARAVQVIDTHRG
jgi:1,4-alpha-glucan branching enzyme